MAYPDTCPVSFTCMPMASVWVITLHSLFLYLDPPLPCHPPCYWLRLFSSQTFSRINTQTFSDPVILHTYPSMKMGNRQSVPKHRRIKFRRRGITQKKAYNMSSFVNVDQGLLCLCTICCALEEGGWVHKSERMLKIWSNISFFVCFVVSICFGVEFVLIIMV